MSATQVTARHAIHEVVSPKADAVEEGKSMFNIGAAGHVATCASASFFYLRQ
jgi:hypothetical protein